MGLVFRSIKKIFFWRYDRTTWQYDVLCVLILAFIFLTPKSWFANGERVLFLGHQSSLIRVYLPVTAESDTSIGQSEIESRVRALTGRSDARIMNVQRRVDDKGKIVAYEVDIK
jgi:hypothetical protein